MIKARHQRIVAAVLAGVVSLSCSSLGFDTAGEEADAAADPASTAATAVRSELADFLDSIPAAEIPELDLEMALSLVAMPLSCLDRPHAAPRDRSTYLDEVVAARRPGYERDRSFYGCWDWHSAVNSTWAMVRINKEFPRIPVFGLIREKLNDHLSKAAMDGELEFFQESRTFERTYGWAWLLQLHAELRTWESPEATAWADNVEPLADLFAERMVEYLPDLERPSRSGAHANTAFSLALMLDYARTLDNEELETAIVEASRRLFSEDLSCPTAYEPWGSDFLSPCLEEAALMADVLEPDEFLAWFDTFMPPVDSFAFAPLTTPVDVSDDGETDGDEASAGVDDAASAETVAASPTDVLPLDAAPDAPATGDDLEPEDDQERREEQQADDAARRELASKSHLIGLAFIRADAMNRIAGALPADDSRVAAYRKLAARHGAMGFEAMFDADYAGSHWIGTFALKYLLTEQG